MTPLHVDDAFVSHYQLNYDPFAAKVPNFKFFAAQRKPVLGQLHHLARYSQLLLVVMGPEGSGKTLLRQALVASTNKQVVQNLVISASNAGSRTALLAYIAQGLQAPLIGLEGVQDRIKQLAVTGQEVHLIVDDAQLLDDEAVQTLIDLASGVDESRAHVFLFSDPDMEPRLAQLAEGQDRFHIIHLAPYTEEETREYLALRLENAGQDLSLFDDDQLAEIYQQSGGWPGLINEVARDVLIEGMQLEQKGQSRAAASTRVPKKHILALAVVLLGVAAAWYMQGRPDNEQYAPSLSSDLPLNSASEVAVAPASPFVGANEPAPVVAAPQRPVGEPVPLALPNTASPVIRQPLAEAAAPGPEEDVIAPAPAVVAVNAQTPAEPVKPITITQPKPVPAPAPVVSAPAVKPAPAAAPVAKPQAAPAKASGGNWYHSQPAANYSLQVFATAKEENAKGYINQFGEGFHYFKKQHQGQWLYVVTYGSFASAQAASSAVASLPLKVREAKPWPKTIATIRQEMAP